MTSHLHKCSLAWISYKIRVLISIIIIITNIIYDAIATTTTNPYCTLIMHVKFTYFT